MSHDAVEFVLKAVEMVAEHGWKLLPQVRKGKQKHCDNCTEMSFSTSLCWFAFSWPIENRVRRHVRRGKPKLPPADTGCTCDYIEKATEKKKKTDAAEQRCASLQDCCSYGSLLVTSVIIFSLSVLFSICSTLRLENGSIENTR